MSKIPAALVFAACVGGVIAAEACVPHDGLLAQMLAVGGIWAFFAAI